MYVPVAIITLLLLGLNTFIDHIKFVCIWFFIDADIFEERGSCEEEWCRFQSRKHYHCTKCQYSSYKVRKTPFENIQN